METLNLMVQIGRAEAAASQVYGDYGLDFGGGNLDSIWGVEQAVVALAGLPADAWQSAEGQGLISDIQSILTTYAGDVNRLAEHVPVTRSALAKDLAQFNQTLPTAHDLVVRSSQLWNESQGEPAK
ncbi:MAG: hypothetical protein ACYC5Y_03270 [Symbiobacteriia bacterium]